MVGEGMLHYREQNFDWLENPKILPDIQRNGASCVVYD